MRNIVFIAIALVLAIAATVLAFIFIVPEKRREKLGAFGKFLHDACTFKFLLVEKILQALYIFSTAFIVLYGVFLLFNVEYSYWGGTHWTGGVGLLCILLGPILIRLSYELMMMAILLLKNVISINRKLADQTGKDEGDVFNGSAVEELREAARQRKAAKAAQAAQAAQSAAPAQSANFCGQCGAKLENGVCPHCTAPQSDAPQE